MGHRFIMWDKDLELVGRSILSCSRLAKVVKRKNITFLKDLAKKYRRKKNQRGLPPLPIAYEESELMVIAASSDDWELLDCLLELGADVNAVSKCGHTPLYRACSWNGTEKNIEVLIAHGADVNWSKDNGKTCLMASVTSLQHCQTLVQHGANVHAQNGEGETVLHYAIRLSSFKVTKFLIEHGADPTFQNHLGHDALVSSSLLKTMEIYNYVNERWKFPPKSKTDALLLIGCNYLFDESESSRDEAHCGWLNEEAYEMLNYRETDSLIHDPCLVCAPLACKYWKKALKVRQDNDGDFSVKSRPSDETLPTSPFSDDVTFGTVEELERIFPSILSLRIQALVISERLLSPLHPFFLRKLFAFCQLHTGVDYEHRLPVMVYLLKLLFYKDEYKQFYVGIMHYSLANALVRCINDHKNNDTVIRRDLIVEIAEILLDRLPNTMSGDNRSYAHDIALAVLGFIFYILYSISNTDSEMSTLKKIIKKSVGVHSMEGYTMPHISVIRHFYLDVFDPGFFELLLECGHHVNDVNFKNCTAIEIFVRNCQIPLNENDQAVVNVLLNHGAHVHWSKRYDHFLKYEKEMIPKIFAPMTLQCFAAKAIVCHGIPYKNVVPIAMQRFIQVH